MYIHGKFDTFARGNVARQQGTFLLMQWMNMKKCMYIHLPVRHNSESFHESMTCNWPGQVSDHVSNGVLWKLGMSDTKVPGGHQKVGKTRPESGSYPQSCAVTTLKRGCFNSTCTTWAIHHCLVGFKRLKTWVGIIIASSYHIIPIGLHITNMFDTAN